ncbi:MAG: hypothetical protein K0R92_2270 [Lachnospiraceae bacterium]|jgi:spore germination protein|nr:hypothetical protein [Lachnospiraceae bacterium]
MIIHVVQPDETAGSIANTYGISEVRLIQENEIKEPNHLVTGEALVILFPDITYIVKEGDSLEGIAEAFDISVMQLLRNNPYLSEREYIFPGEMIVISYKGDKIGEMAVSGYAYPFIESTLLKKTLPFLTYLTIYHYTIDAKGNVSDLEDEEVIKTAKEYGVAPVMLISSMKENNGDSDIMQEFLADEASKMRFIVNVLSMLKRKGYYGINFDLPYIHPKDQETFLNYLKMLTTRLNGEGYEVTVTISPNSFEIASSYIFYRSFYSKAGEIANKVMILPYEWGYQLGLPVSLVVPFQTAVKLLDFYVQKVPPERTSVAVLNIGHIWELPYIEGETKAQAICYTAAIELAREVGATIYFDEDSAAAYYGFTTSKEYFVRFKDGRSIYDMVEMVPKYGFEGIGIWNIMSYFPQMWLVINSQYVIKKVI